MDDRSHSLIRFRAFEASTRRLSPRCGGFVCPSVHGNWLSLCERKIFQRFTLQDYFECFSGQVRSSMGAYAGAVYNQIPLRLMYSFGLRVAIAQAGPDAHIPQIGLHPTQSRSMRLPSDADMTEWNKLSSNRLLPTKSLNWGFTVSGPSSLVSCIIQRSGRI